MEPLDTLNAPEPIYLTAEGHQRLQQELQMLMVDKRAEIAERIRASKDHGEFSEDNNELDEVKQQQAIIENRISELKAILANVEILTLDLIETERVGLGSRVSVRDASRGTEFEVQLVSGVEADPDRDLISEDSPMGQALLGREVGDVAEFDAPVGLVSYEIVKISA